MQRNSRFIPSLEAFLSDQYAGLVAPMTLTRLHAYVLCLCTRVIQARDHNPLPRYGRLTTQDALTQGCLTVDGEAALVTAFAQWFRGV